MTLILVTQFYILSPNFDFAMNLKFNYDLLS